MGAGPQSLQRLMRITVHSVCGKMPRWVQQGVEDYEKRLPKELKLQWRDVPLTRRGGDRSSDQLKENDGVAKTFWNPWNMSQIAIILPTCS